MTFTDFASLITGGAQLSALLFLVWAFYNGELISKKTLDKIMDSYQKQGAENMEKSVEKILDAIKRRGW